MVPLGTDTLQGEKHRFLDERDAEVSLEGLPKCRDGLPRCGT
jgi:hypothetical protein